MTSQDLEPNFPSDEKAVCMPVTESLLVGHLPAFFDYIIIFLFPVTSVLTCFFKCKTF